MKSASVKEIKEELKNHSHKELVELCLSLAKFKKENKELLTYLLYESENEDLFVAGVKSEMETAFSDINNTNYYLIKKSIRKILRTVRKYIRYSKKPETALDLRLHFCKQLQNFTPPISGNATLMKLYQRELETMQSDLKNLHEDLQADYNFELNRLTSANN